MALVVGHKFQLSLFDLEPIRLAHRCLFLESSLPPRFLLQTDRVSTMPAAGTDRRPIQQACSACWLGRRISAPVVAICLAAHHRGHGFPAKVRLPSPVGRSTVFVVAINDGDKDNILLCLSFPKI